jgi:hypothetical protein
MRQPIYPNLFFTGANLQLLEDGLGAGEVEAVLGDLLGGVGDLAVVDDDHVTVGAALLISPADALGELGVGVGKEELKKKDKSVN